MVKEVGYEDLTNIIPTTIPVAGISDIKIDRQIGVYKAYLDTCMVGGYKSITGVAVGADPFTISVPFSATSPNLPLTTTGKLNWIIDANGYIVVPVTGTYIISGFTQFYKAADTTVAGLFTRIVYKSANGLTTGVIYQSSNYRLLDNDTVMFSQVQNIEQGDRFIMYSGHSVTGVAIDVYQYFYLTLLS